MRLNTIATLGFLTFVGASGAWLEAKEGRSDRQPAPQESSSVSPTLRAAPWTRPAAPKSKERKTVRKVIAYYFHGNMRCMTCRAIEAQTKAAIETGFSKAFKDGRVEWKVVNIDEAEHEHFVQDFQLAASSVILERFAGGKRQEWKNLKRVWELVRDKEAFKRYVQDETRSYLEPGSK